MNGTRADCIADTSVVIGLSRRDPEITRLVSARNYAVTFVTVAELSLGLLKASDSRSAWARVEGWLRGRNVLNPSKATPLHYARICHGLEQRGLRIPANDMWVAALALENGLPLLARDEHFSRVSGLTLIPC